MYSLSSLLDVPTKEEQVYTSFQVQHSLNQRVYERDLLEPSLDALSRASKLVPQAHSDHVSYVSKRSRHPGQALDPETRVEVLVAEEPVSIGPAATPTRLADVII